MADCAAEKMTSQGPPFAEPKTMMIFLDLRPGVKRGSVSNRKSQAAPESQPAGRGHRGWWPLSPEYLEQSRRPLVSLAFIVPLLATYEGGVIYLGPAALRNGADVWLRHLLGLVRLWAIFFAPRADRRPAVGLAPHDAPAVATAARNRAGHVFGKHRPGVRAVGHRLSGAQPVAVGRGRVDSERRRPASSEQRPERTPPSPAISARRTARRTQRCADAATHRARGAAIAGCDDHGFVARRRGWSAFAAPGSTKRRCFDYCCCHPWRGCWDCFP